MSACSSYELNGSIATITLDDRALVAPRPIVLSSP
jgi:hypothetical protein